MKNNKRKIKRLENTYGIQLWTYYIEYLVICDNLPEEIIRLMSFYLNFNLY